MSKKSLSDMNFGIHLGSVNTKHWAGVAAAADELGFESVWVPEHLVVPLTPDGSGHVGQELHRMTPSDTIIHDPFTALAFIAARTSRLRLGTHVYNIGLRHPFTTARSSTTLDVMSGGRFLLGIGASWIRPEWEAVGLDFDSRGKRIDEAIEICQRLWRDDVIEFHGEFFDFGPTQFAPKPIQRPGIGLHIGGDGAPAMRRAATVGAGWMPMLTPVEEMKAARARLQAKCEEVGRTTPVEVTIPGKDVRTLADVERYANAGVDRIIVFPWRSSKDAVDGMRRFVDEVLDPLGLT